MTYHFAKLFERVKFCLESAPGLSLNDISDRVGVGRHTVLRVVKGATGKTFREFRNSLVLDKATSLLGGEPNTQIKEIAYIVGYQSHRSFCRFIRATTGRSPRQFREPRAAPGAAVGA